MSLKEGVDLPGQKLKHNKSVIVLLSVFIILNAYWIFSLRILPFVDLPLHLSAAVLSKTIDNTDNGLHEYYDLQSGFQSNLFHLWFTKQFDNAETGNKMFYLIYIIIFTAIFYLFIYKLKGNLYYSLFVFLLMYNFNTMWGFTGYTISIPLVLFFCYLLVFYYDLSLMSEIFLSILTLIIFIVHFQSSMFCVLIFFVYNIYFYIKTRKFNKSGFLIIIIPLAVIFIYGYFSNTSQHDIPLFDYLYNYYIYDFIRKLPEKIINLTIYDNYFLYRYLKGEILASMIFFILTGPFIYSIITKKNKIIKSDYLGIIYLILIVTALCYLLLPYDIPGQSMVYQRFSIYIIIFSVICGSILLPIIVDKKFTMVVIIIIVTAHYILISDYFNGFKNETETFTTEILPPKSSNDVMGALVYEPFYRGFPSYIHFPLYNLIWNENPTVGLVDYRFFIIKRKTDMKIFPPYNAWVGLRFDYRGEYDDLKYVLVKGELINELPHFEEIKTNGTWKLFEKK